MYEKLWNIKIFQYTLGNVTCHIYISEKKTNEKKTSKQKTMKTKTNPCYSEEEF